MARGYVKWVPDPDEAGYQVIVVIDACERLVGEPLEAELGDGFEDWAEGAAVDYDLVDGQPVKVKLATRAVGRRKSVARPYHHPYYFVPMPPRSTSADLPLGDRFPAGHHRLHGDLWTGAIDIAITVESPLLLPDLADDSAAAHKTYGIRRGSDGRPYLPPTSLKGMLRTAYEAATNSRLGVFEAHETRLAHREATSEALHKVPFRVNKAGQIELLRRARLPRYRGFTLKTSTGQTPAHGDQVWVRIDSTGVPTVTDIEPWAATPPGATGWVSGWVCVTGENIGPKRYEQVFHGTAVQSIDITEAHEELWEDCIRSYHAANERDIRAGRTHPPALSPKLRYSRHIMDSSGSVNTAAIKLLPDTMGYAALDEAGSITGLFPVMISRKLEALPPRELVAESHLPATRRDELSPADRVFGWAHQDGRGAHRGQLRVGATSCVTPAKSAVTSFPAPLPLAILGQPKPQQVRFYVAADRFGRVASDGEDCTDVGYSRPTQGLRGRKIYPHHRDLPAGYWEPITGNDGPQPVGGRYREYVHPGSGDDRRSDQNRSVREWVQPGTQFTCRLHVTNLSTVELGALLWLLTWRADHFHRLGGGKPLGFGSVQVAPLRIVLSRGRVWARRYRVLDAAPTTAPPEDVVAWSATSGTPLKPDDLAPIQAYRQALQAADRQAFETTVDRPFEMIPAIKALLAAAKGFETPIHYPRGTAAPNPEGEGYEWFVENEADRKDEVHWYALPGLDEKETGLPYLQRPRKRTQDGSGGRAGRGGGRPAHDGGGGGRHGGGRRDGGGGRGNWGGGNRRR